MNSIGVILSFEERIEVARLISKVLTVTLCHPYENTLRSGVSDKKMSVHPNLNLRYIRYTQ